MPNPDDVKRIAKSTADYYDDHKGKPLADFVKRHWQSDVVICQSGRPPYGMEQFLREHSPDSGMSWDATRMKTQKLVVGEDSFVLYYHIVSWRTHEADHIAASGENRKAGLEGYQTTVIPGISIFTVGDSGKVARMDGFVFMPPDLVAKGAVVY